MKGVLSQDIQQFWFSPCLDNKWFFYDLVYDRDGMVQGGKGFSRRTCLINDRSRV